MDGWMGGSAAAPSPLLFYGQRSAAPVPQPPTRNPSPAHPQMHTSRSAACGYRQATCGSGGTAGVGEWSGAGGGTQAPSKGAEKRWHMAQLVAQMLRRARHPPRMPCGLEVHSAAWLTASRLPVRPATPAAAPAARSTYMATKARTHHTWAARGTAHT